MDYFDTKNLDHELVRQEITLKIAKMNHIELANFCINNGIAFAKVQKEKLDMRGTSAVMGEREMERHFMVAMTGEGYVGGAKMPDLNLEPIPFPDLYDGVNLESVSDDVQMHMENQERAARNKALGI